MIHVGLPWWSSGKDSVLPMQGPGFDPWSGNQIPATKLILATRLWLKILHTTMKKIWDAATKKAPKPKDTCTRMFTQHNLQQPRHRDDQCPPTDGRLKKVRAHSGLPPGRKEEWNSAPAATRTDQENVMLSGVRWRMANTIYHITYMWNLKTTNESIYKNRLTDIENKLQKWDWRGRN